MALTGCYEIAGERQPGELGNGGFYWICSTAADPACDAAGDAAEAFPERVALGSKFRLQYLTDYNDPVNVASGSSHIVEQNLVGRFEAVAPGYASMVVYRDGQVYDFLHLNVRPIDDVGLVGDVGPNGLAVGERAAIRANPRCEGLLCAGSMPYQWVVDRPEILWLQKSEDRSSEVMVEGVAPGEATVHLSHQELALASLSVTVVGDEVPTTSTGDTGSTGSTGGKGTTSSTGDTGGGR